MQFYLVEPVTSSLHTPNLLPTLSHVERELLNLLATVAEGKKVVFDMGPNKAPSPDWFLSSLFQQYWDILQPLV